MSLAMVLLCVCCSDDGSDSGISLKSASAVEIYSVVNQSTDIEFQSSGDWTASCSANWLAFSPRQGTAGAGKIRVRTTSTNRTKSTRTAQLIITSGGQSKNVTIIQSNRYAVFDQKEYIVDAAGGALTMGIKSNFEDGEVMNILYNHEDWLSMTNKSSASRGEWSMDILRLVIEPNKEKSGRRTSFCLVTTVGSDDRVGLDTAYVYQKGVDEGYMSTDYSADGTVTLMQKATKGQGIPVVLMGDGFADKDIANGNYAQVMEKAMENLFSEEPVQSLRDYFTVYAVAAVSKHSNVGKEYSTVFSTVPSKTSTDIAFDGSQVMRYVRKTNIRDSLNALAVVILNANTHNGITYWYSDGKTGKGVQYSVSLCPVIGDLENESFREVLVHEAIGHGLAKLSDEYGYKSNGMATPEAIEQLKAMQAYQWLQNVDTTDDAESVLWSPFIGDSHFASEHIGIYEGGYTYTTGIYRPTEDSMMNSNESPFNAPCRKIIYDKVMELGYGKAASTLEEFCIFDEAHKPQRWSYATTRGLGFLPAPRFASPRLMKR